VNKISTKQRRTTGKLLKTIIAAGALAACGIAQAYVLNFEQPKADTPFFFSGDHVKMGEFWVESYGGLAAGDFVGTVIDGSDPTICMAVACPVNNKSNYYAGMDDGYFYFGMNDNANFRVQSLQAAFIGAQDSYAATAGLLVLQGYNAAGVAVGGALQIGLAGPNAKGEFNFATYNLGAFGNTTVNYVRVLGYACDSTGSCNRSNDVANYAIDNIVTVPEPTTLALFGLGIAGVAAFARRRRA
jgi:hypothetical protein